MLAKACDSQAEAVREQESELKALVYPLTQVALGSIKYAIIAFRYYLVYPLIDFAGSSRVRVPIRSTYTLSVQ